MRVLLLLVVLGLTGCGITTSARIRESTVETTSFVFRDMRPPEQRSSQVSRSEGAVTWATFADDNLAPSPPDLVRTALQRKLGETLASRTVTLSKFSLSVVDVANSR